MVKLGALLFVLFVNTTYAIQFQLLGGIWIVQTFPAIVAGLYTRWFHRWALVIGWAVAMVFGTIAAYRLPSPGEPGTHFGASADTVPIIGHTVYIGLTGLVMNLVIATLLTLLFRAVKVPGRRRTRRGPSSTWPTRTRRRPRPIPVVAGAVGGTGSRQRLTARPGPARPGWPGAPAPHLGASGTTPPGASGTMFAASY